MDTSRRGSQDLPDAVWAAHDAAVGEGSEHYIDPLSGLLSFTEVHHRRRGHCCDSDCRHCPYRD